MVLRKGTPNLSNAFYRKGQGLYTHGNILYGTPYRELQTNTAGHIARASSAMIRGAEGDGLWDSIIAPGLLKLGSVVGKAATFVPTVVNYVKPLASAAMPIFDATMRIKEAANQAKQLRLMREMAMKNYDAKLSAGRAAAKPLSNEQKEKIAQIVMPSAIVAPQTTTPSTVTPTPSVVTPAVESVTPIRAASGSGCSGARSRSRRKKLGAGFRNF